MNKLERINIDKLSYKKVEDQLDLVLKGQEVNQQELRLGFIGLAKQNQELLNLNNQLSEQLITSITGSDYKSVRLRLAILILTICGIRVSELIPLKVEQLLTLGK